MAGDRLAIDHTRQTDEGVHMAIQGVALPRRDMMQRTFGFQFVVAVLVALAMFASMLGVQTQSASAGQIGYVTTQGAELMVHPTDLSVITTMEAWTPVDILFGPYSGMYEIRYGGIDGWVWAEMIDVDGAPEASVGGSTGPVATSSEERWVDVNRSSGVVSLMVGESVTGQFGASMGYDSSASGFYSTAVGTYYIYQFDITLHYTEFAGNYIDHWIGFDPTRFNGFHSYTKDESGKIIPNGDGLTGGCVALAPGDIDALWNFAEMGMRVEVHF